MEEKKMTDKFNEVLEKLKKKEPEVNKNPKEEEKEEEEDEEKKAIEIFRRQVSELHNDGLFRINLLNELSEIKSNMQELVKTIKKLTER